MTGWIDADCVRVGVKQWSVGEYRRRVKESSTVYLRDSESCKLRSFSKINFLVKFKFVGGLMNSKYRKSYRTTLEIVWCANNGIMWIFSD